MAPRLSTLGAACLALAQISQAFMIPYPTSTTDLSLDELKKSAKESWDDVIEALPVPNKPVFEEEVEYLTSTENLDFDFDLEYVDANTEDLDFPVPAEKFEDFLESHGIDLDEVKSDFKESIEKLDDFFEDFLDSHSIHLDEGESDLSELSDIIDLDGFVGWWNDVDESNKQKESEKTPIHKLQPPRIHGGPNKFWNVGKGANGKPHGQRRPCANRQRPQTHSFAEKLRHTVYSVCSAIRTFVTSFLLPVLVGIAAGMAASLLGMMVGTLLGWIWVKLFGRKARPEIGTEHIIVDVKYANPADGEKATLLEVNETELTDEELPVYVEKE